MAFSDSRILLKHIPWKTSPPRCVTSKNRVQPKLRSTPPQTQSRTAKSLLPINLLVKFQESFKSPLCKRVAGHIIETSVVHTLTTNNSEHVLDNIIQPLRNTVNIKGIVPIQEDPSVDTPNRIHILKSGLEDEKQNTKRLGQGSFGSIFQATYKGNKVAVKLIPLQHYEKSSISLQNEANALDLVHPNIVRVLQVICPEHISNYGIVIMELCCGLNLHTLLEDPVFEVDPLNRIKFAIDIASAIEHCHNKGIVHLDIKPQNIIVCHFNVCKLCDFGSSCVLEDGNLPISNYQNLGTLIYTDPEILQNQRASKQSDIYSYGITLWQLLSREIPYITCSLHEQAIIYKVVAQEFRPREILDINGKEKKYIQLYKICWQQNPLCRPQSMFYIIQELEMIAYVLILQAECSMSMSNGSA